MNEKTIDFHTHAFPDELAPRAIMILGIADCRLRIWKLG
jgi:hypothetical protein